MTTNKQLTKQDVMRLLDRLEVSGDMKQWFAGTEGVLEEMWAALTKPGATAGVGAGVRVYLVEWAWALADALRLSNAAEDAVHNCVRRALRYAADAQDKAGLSSGDELRDIANASELDLDEAWDTAFRVNASGPVAGAPVEVINVIGDMEVAMGWAAEAASRAASKSIIDADDAIFAEEHERTHQAEDLRSLYPAVRAAAVRVLAMEPQPGEGARSRHC